MQNFSPPLSDQALTQPRAESNWLGTHHKEEAVCVESQRLMPAAAAKSLQSCLTRCNPIDSSPPGSPVPGILQARILEWVAISFSSRLMPN